MKKYSCDAWVNMAIQNMPTIEANTPEEAEEKFIEMLKSGEIDLSELSNDSDNFTVNVVEEKI